MTMSTKLGKMVTYHEVLLHIELLNLWSRILARSHDKLLPLYVQYCSAYGHQTWDDGDLP